MATPASSSFFSRDRRWSLLRIGGRFSHAAFNLALHAQQAPLTPSPAALELQPFRGRTPQTPQPGGSHPFQLVAPRDKGRSYPPVRGGSNPCMSPASSARRVKREGCSLGAARAETLGASAAKPDKNLTSAPLIAWVVSLSAQKPAVSSGFCEVRVPKTRPSSKNSPEPANHAIPFLPVSQARAVISLAQWMLLAPLTSARLGLLKHSRQRSSFESLR